VIGQHFFDSGLNTDFASLSREAPEIAKEDEHYGWFWSSLKDPFIENDTIFVTAVWQKDGV
jgi:hypothetical protein